MNDNTGYIKSTISLIYTMDKTYACPESETEKEQIDDIVTDWFEKNLNVEVTNVEFDNQFLDITFENECKVQLMDGQIINCESGYYFLDLDDYKRVKDEFLELKKEFPAVSDVGIGFQDYTFDYDHIELEYLEEDWDEEYDGELDELEDEFDER